MIAVINVSEEYGIPYSRGNIQRYRVQLNNIHLVEYDFDASEGMVECLASASKALIGVDIDGKISEHLKHKLYNFIEGYGQ